MSETASEGVGGELEEVVGADAVCAGVEVGVGAAGAGGVEVGALRISIRI